MYPAVWFGIKYNCFRLVSASSAKSDKNTADVIRINSILISDTATPLILPVPFFRHIKGNGAVRPGGQFGKDHLYKWWKKACRNLKIEGVDLYGGTRHSTATALGEHFSRQEIMTAGSLHKTNKAALRYMQAEKNRSILVYRKVRQMQGEVIKIGKQKAG